MDLIAAIEDLQQRVAKLEARKRARSPLTEEEWFAELKTNPLYHGIDIDREYQKMIEWCKPRNFQPTRRRFVNWMNKSDKPLNISSGSGNGSAAREELLDALKNANNAVMPYMGIKAKELFFAQKKRWRDLQAEVQAGIVGF